MYYSKFNKLTTYDYNLVNYTSTNSGNLINYKIMSKITEQPYVETKEIITHKHWNKYYNQNAICKCGHAYYRHFDAYDNMNNVGCKYCGCNDFQLRPEREVSEIEKEITEIKLQHNDLTKKLNQVKQELNDKYHHYKISIDKYDSAQLFNFNMYNIILTFSKSEVFFKVLKSKWSFEKFKNHIIKFTK